MTLFEIISPQALATFLVALSGFLVVLGLALPRLRKENLQRRLAKVAIEHGGNKTMTENSPVLAFLGLGPKRRGARGAAVNSPMARLLGDKSEAILRQLRMAGFRNGSALQVYMAFRVLLPVALGAFTAFYATTVLGKDPHLKNLLMFSGGGAVLGYLLPPMYLSNKVTKRQLSIQRAWPDALDLLLICVESGYGIDAALIRLSEEIGMQSEELAEEISLTALELSYLQDRSKALDNLSERTGLDPVRQVVGSLKQTEKYGTDLGRALRVHAQESRDLRLEKAKEKAAALPPKLTVPMIVFFLPILFVIIIAPAIIQIMQG